VERFIEIFEVPGAATGVIAQIVSSEEIALVEAVGRGSFTVDDAAISLEQTGKPLAGDRLAELLRSAYKRGILLLEDESFTKFKAGNFYCRLDIFAITETEKYLAFPPETRKALDEWYFGAYVKGLGDEPRPTGDRVVGLSEAFDFIDKADRPIWLNRCDCRLLAGNCEKPVDTCISLRGGINTMSHRGWSKPLTKEQAKEIISRAHTAGLMQTINPNGLCNCCGDCCYLFRAQKARNSAAVWPQAENIAAFDANACIACGQCVGRCNFAAFTQDEEGISYDSGLCRGCGLCATTCPASAIRMKRRNSDEYGG
jgi:Pyruvate/2-oxoacid:ferredoxin oxidoreductase delta subunit